MSTFTIPNSQGQIRQDNRGDNRGELWETFGCDLSTTPGKILTGKKLVKVLDQTTNLDGDDIEALLVYETFYYAVTVNNVYECNIANDPTDPANWTKNTTISTIPTGSMDTTIFEGDVLISRGSNIARWELSTLTPTWWTGVSGSFASSDYHVLHTHRGGAETLFATDGTSVRYYNTTAGHSVVALGLTMKSSCITSGVDAVWVGTYTESSESAYVYQIYVGETTASGTPVARNAYKVEGRAVLSIDVIDNVPYIITEKGNIQAFNGAGFTTVASFPFSFGSETLEGVNTYSVASDPNARPIHPKGMRSHNNSLYILINSQKDLGTDPATRTPSGLWEYNKETGQLNHRQPLAESSTDNGAKVLSKTGPILITANANTFFLTGGKIGTTSGMFGETGATPMSYFVTKEIESQTVADAFESVYLKAKRMAPTENISLKYRYLQNLGIVGEKDAVFAGVTYADTNIINTTDTVSTVEVGDEVTDTATGNIAHVTSIDSSLNTTSFTLDTSIGTTGVTSRVEFQNWKLHPKTYTQEDGSVKKFGVGESSPWIQYKVTGMGDVEFRQFISKGNSKTEL